ncbi:histidine phosphatase family protein [Phenylobacterium sp.]|uniref:histidine phosphatase family protein n=1 Tax=Phenylobacterium sp. TaxID=1871053 RepID=UPI0026159281|nr:histidine phosphatase family protein [Phenylobacterium sp.]
MAQILFVTHPEVVIDPEVPVPRWPLSAKGRARMEALAEALAGLPVRAIWSSDEQKAIDGAEILSERLQAPHRVDAALGENDRSATGYIAPPRFWEVVAEFFAHPDVSVLGWETARDAQSRIRAAMARVESEAQPGLTVVVSHGGVGQLLTAALQGVAIGQEAKSPNPSGGGYLLLEAFPLRLAGDGWGDIDAITADPHWDGLKRDA